MTLNEIITAIRRDIREPSPVTVTDTFITEVIYRGLALIWDALILSDKSFSKERVSLSSDTNSFSLPTNCRTLINVWDMRTTAKDITDATSADPIVITSSAHGLSDGAIVRIHDVGGNTTANGIHELDNTATNTAELLNVDGSAAGAYTSGGKMYQEKSSFTKIYQKNYDEAYHNRKDEYFMEGRNIIVNYPTFSNDLVVDYLKYSSLVTDIPDEFHIGLVSYGVMFLARQPMGNSPVAGDFQKVSDFHSNNWTTMLEKASSYKLSSSPEDLPDRIHWEAFN